MILDWVFILVCVVVVVGLLQWLKSFVKTAKSWVWAVAFFIAAFLVPPAMLYLPGWVHFGLIVLAVGQLGYENVIQLVKSKLGAAGVKNGLPV